MGYCTLEEVDSILAQALTSATNPTSQARRNLLKIGAVRDKNSISDTLAEQYIQWASQEIDSHISQLYKTPICELADFESALFSDLDEYNGFIVLDANCPLCAGDNIILSYQGMEERHVIDEAVGEGIFSTESPIQFAFPADTRVIRVKFPDPLPWICSRLAAANIYDKFFASQQSPNMSDYGKSLREQARAKVNDVLNGRTILHGVTRIGRRLYDPTISDQYGLPTGERKGMARDVDKLS